MFKKYERLPKTVEAVQFNEANKDRVFNALTGGCLAGFEDGKPIIQVTTIHGEIAIVRIGDFIVKEPKAGYYYPIKDDIFRDGYAQYIWVWMLDFIINFAAVILLFFSGGLSAVAVGIGYGVYSYRKGFKNNRREAKK